MEVSEPESVGINWRIAGLAASGGRMDSPLWKYGQLNEVTNPTVRIIRSTKSSTKPRDLGGEFFLLLSVVEFEAILSVEEIGQYNKEPNKPGIAKIL
jgi:hypothetical protein